MIFYAVFFVASQAVFLRASLYESIGPGQIGGPASIDGFSSALGDPFIRLAIFRTLQLSALTAVIASLIGLPIAYAIARSRRWGGVLFVLVVASMFSSAVARVLGWRVLLGRTGIINSVLMSIGLIDEPLVLVSNFTGVIIGTVHALMPLAIIGTIPVCESLPRPLLEAAESLGASRWRTFWQVIIPHVRRGVVGMGLVVFAVTAGAFTTPALLGGGRVAVLPILIRTQMVQAFDYASASTLAVILITIVAITVLLTLLLSDRRRRTTIPGE